MQTERVTYPDGADCYYVGKKGEGLCIGIDLTRQDNAFKIVRLDAIGRKGRPVEATITFPLTEIDNVIAALTRLKPVTDQKPPPGPNTSNVYTVTGVFTVPDTLTVAELRDELQEKLYDHGGMAGDFNIDRLEGGKAFMTFTRSVHDDRRYGLRKNPGDLADGLRQQLQGEVQEARDDHGLTYPFEVGELKYMDPGVPDEVTTGTG